MKLAALVLLLSSGAMACQPAEPVRVQLFGDSTMAGKDGATKKIAARPPAVLLQGYFDRRFGAGAVNVTSRAVSATTAVRLIAGQDGLNKPWPQSVDADLVVVNHGINDLRHHGDAAAYRAALSTIAAGPVPVVFQTPSPIRIGPDLGGYAAIMRDVAAQHRAPVADVHAYVAALPGWKSYIPDWGHPSQALYERLAAEVVGPALSPVVAKLLHPRCASKKPTMSVASY